MDFLESVVRMAGIDEEQQLPLVEVPENPSQAGAAESDVAFYTAPFEPAAAVLVSDDCDEESAAIMAKASDGGNTVDLIHSVVKMAVDDDDGSSSSLAARRRRARSESGCTDDEDTSAAAVVVEAARHAAQEDPPKSYFNELFPRLDLDGEAWLRAWPKFTTGARQQLCHDDSGCHRATYEQYEFNLKMYEWDAWSGNYRNRDLRRQDEIQRRLETDPSLYDQKMYMDYYGRRDASGGHGFSSPWDRNNTFFPPPTTTMDHPTQWNSGGARVKHEADMSSLYEQHGSSFGPDRSRLNVPQQKMAAANMTKSGVNLKSRRDVYSTSTGTRFRPLPPSPMVVPPQQQQQPLRCYNYNN